MTFFYRWLFPALLIITGLSFACTNEHAHEGETSDREEILPPEWAVNANIYEVNIRQFSEEGTFNAFSEHIPRLQEMGVKILWFMPVHPIGEENRKGTLGSYYSIVDFTEVNPEFGTKEDFRAMVEKAHDHGMKVIMDWVANHTAWDAVWTQTNPEFYETDDDGNFFPPNEDWDDVIQLDVESREMWDAMIGAMTYWVEEYDVDGFRADVAYLLPTEFWDTARERLEEIKPVFMLAEAEEPELHSAFDMSYTWYLAQTMRDFGAGEATLADIDEALERNFEMFDKKDYRMVFTTNHDENSWQGSDTDLYGDNYINMKVFAATVWGMPLIYNGQESGLYQSLEFFEKDQIEWGDYKYNDFYATLLDLNTRNQALFNGEIGGDYRKLSTDQDEHIFSYKRTGHHEQVLVILNFSDEQQTFTFEEGDLGEWTDVFDQSTHSVSGEITLDANDFMLLERVHVNH